MIVNNTNFNCLQIIINISFVYTGNVDQTFIKENTFTGKYVNSLGYTLISWEYRISLGPIK